MADDLVERLIDLDEAVGSPTARAAAAIRALKQPEPT